MPPRGLWDRRLGTTVRPVGARNPVLDRLRIRPAWRPSGSSACRDEPSGDGEFGAIVIRVFPEFEELRVSRPSRRRVAEGLRGARDPVDRHRPAWSTLQSLGEVLRGLGGSFQLQEDRPVELVRRNDRIRRAREGLGWVFGLARAFSYPDDTRRVFAAGGGPRPCPLCLGNDDPPRNPPRSR